MSVLDLTTLHNIAKPGQASYIKEEFEKGGPDQAGKLYTVINMAMTIIVD